jgi:hypothetical protein
MTRDEMIEIISDYLYESCGIQCKVDENKLLKIIEEHMMPKYGGKHQSSYDLAMGSKPEWDKE